MNKEKPLEYGEVRAASGVSDIELLQRIKLIEQQERLSNGKRAAEVDLEGNIIAYESDEEEEDGDDDDEEGEWMEVEDGDEDEDEEGDDGDGDEEEEEEEVTFTKKMKSILYQVISLFRSVK